MRNRIIIFIALLLTALGIFYLILENTDSNFQFDKYTKIRIDYPTCHFNIKTNRFHICEFKLTNLTDTPFVIIDAKVNNKNNVDFLDSKIKKLIPKDSSTTIRIKVNVTNKTEFYRNIELISNVKGGKILLKINGSTD